MPSTMELSGGNLPNNLFIYNGTPQKARAVLADGTKTLLEGTDYTLNYSNNIEPGQAWITATGLGQYVGKTISAFKVVPVAPNGASAKLIPSSGYKDIKVSWKKARGADSYKVFYWRSGKDSAGFKQTTGTSVTIKDLAAGTKYNVRIIPYINIEGDPYEGQKKDLTVTTLKKMSTPSISKVSSSKIKIKFTNISGESGYQISKSTSKTKTSVVSTFATTTAKSKVIKTKKGKTYYYKIRAYKTVDGKKVYGPWSSAKAYKLK